MIPLLCVAESGRGKMLLLGVLQKCVLFFLCLCLCVRVRLHCWLCESQEKIICRRFQQC